MIGHRLIILIVLVSCSVTPLPSQVSNSKDLEAKTKEASADPRAVAEALLESRKYQEAIAAYEALIAENPTSIAARIGLIRSYSKAGKLKKALDCATEARAKYPDSGDLKVAMGEVLFRRGEIAAAEKIFRSAWLNDDNNVNAMLGLARIYEAMSLHKRAYLMRKAAYDIAPNDPNVVGTWETTIPQTERIKLIERRLEEAKTKAPDEVENIKRHLEAVKTLEDKMQHRCELVSKLDRTEAELRPLKGDVRKLGLEVAINSKKTKLLLDTAASGITIDRSEADKSGVKRLSTVYYSGAGDNRVVPGFEGYVESIEIAGLQFRDCRVNVMERRSSDGVVGSDMFKDYLVSIDFPGKKLKLSPLPKRPDESGIAATPDTSGYKPAGSFSTTENLPLDRYIAPEMATWTPVYLFGSDLLIPTKVDGGAPRLFLIDTGATTTIFSIDFAREITLVNRDQSVNVKNAVGKIDKVYQANSATLEFGRLKQRNENVVTLDLSLTGLDAGTEVSGLLGYSALGLLELKIDYRDGLVDFVYDAEGAHKE